VPSGDVEIDLFAEQIQRTLEVMSRRSMQIPLTELAEELKVGVDDVIQSEGRDGSDGVWEEMSFVTPLIHPRREGGALLQATGILANLQTQTGSDWVEVSSPAKYAGYHITGTRRFGRRYMPKRDFMAIDVDKVLDAMGDLALEEIRR